MTIDRLQLLERSLTVSQTINEAGGKVERQKTAKTAVSRRTVSLPAFLVDDLAQHLAEYPTDNGFVFTGPAGVAVASHQLPAAVWLPAVRASVGEPLRLP